MTVRCPTCDAEQELPEAGIRRCIVCGRDLSGEGGAQREPAGDPDTQPQPAAAKLAATLSTEGPTASSRELEELRAGDRHFEFLTALVPGYGIVRVLRSEILAGGQKLAALLLALGVTALTVIGIRAVIPESGQQAARPEDAVEDQLANLRALVVDYRKQAGEFPDEETWERSVQTVDSQLFDPWGRPYVYRRTADGFEVGTLGRDGVEGGEEENADRFVSFTER